MGQVEKQRGDGYIAVGDHLEVGDVAWGFYRRRQSEPIIAIATRVGSLDDSQPAIVANALAAHADALNLLWRKCGEVDVDQRTGRKRRLHQRTQDPFRP